MPKSLLSLFAGLALASAVPLVQAAGAADQIKVDDAYARAVPPGQPNSAAFGRISNLGSQAHALVDAKSPVAKVVELHTHLMEDGVARMRRVEKIDLPANGSVELKPGGLHIMLIGLEHQLQADERIPLTLRLEDGSEIQLETPVRGIQPMPAGHQH